MRVLASILLLLVPVHASDVISPITRFDARGRLPQSDSASKAVQRGLPTIAITGKESVVIVAPSPARPKLVDLTGLPKMWRLTESMCVSHAGLAQDSRVLLLAAQQAVLNHIDRFGEDPDIADVVEVVAEKQQDATMQGTTRPYGSTVVVAGLTPKRSWHAGQRDSANGGTDGVLEFIPAVYKAEPSGTYTLWKACAVGQDSDRIMAVLEQSYSEDMDLHDMLTLAAKCCAAFQGDSSYLDVSILQPTTCAKRGRRPTVKLYERLPRNDLVGLAAAESVREAS